ncbi:MAG TPA: hypothetical protein VLH39_00060, partial [Magnetospirillaceae bacterium]|nr:hypothetical protein [Magnetospirillaceae bacterium]
DGRRLLGVNTWEGVEWFQKEGFDYFAACATLAVLFPPVKAGPHRKRWNAAESILADLRKAESRAGYRVESMDFGAEKPLHGMRDTGKG